MNQPKAHIAKTRSKAIKPNFSRSREIALNRSTVISYNKGQKRYDYGLENLLPNQLLKAIEASVTASSCRERKQEFIEGNGIQDSELAKTFINPKQTVDDLVMELADVVGLFDGMALAIKYNNLGNPEQVFNVPFELVRKDQSDHYYFNEDLKSGKDIKKNRIYYGNFNPVENAVSRMERIREQIAEYGFQVGDILYIFGKKSGQTDYPIPLAWAGMEEIEADSALGRLDWRNVKKGFRPDVIISKQPEDDDEEDENGYTAADIFDKNITKFTGEDAASMMVIEVEDMSQAPKVDAYSQEKILNGTTEAADRIGKRTCRAMAIPHVLISGFAQSGQLGNTQELINTIKLLNKTIARRQRMIARGLQTVYPSKDFTIEPLNLIDEMPDWLIGVMSNEEIRSLGGLEKLPENETIKQPEL